MELCLTTILITVLIIGFACSGMGFFNCIFEDDTVFEYNMIQIWKSDANKLRIIPRIIFKFFIFIIEHSYKFGQTLGKFLKFLFVI